MDWTHTIGLGVAGNFTGHLEQAGEAADFVNLNSHAQDAPKGIFPFYLPGGGDHVLHSYPISSTTIRLHSEVENHQIEPEVALLCDIDYRKDRVVGLYPRFAMAHNDCSIRRPNARKISEKKNWGPNSKGTSDQMIPIDHLEPGGRLDMYRLACFLYRDGIYHAYGVDSPVVEYSYFHETLIDWLIERMNHQVDEGPLEDISHWLRKTERPDQALISIGATRYTSYGETTFLKAGDRAITLLYDGQNNDAKSLRNHLQQGSLHDVTGISVLDQTVSPVIGSVSTGD